MKLQILKSVVVAAATVTLACSVQAVPITGVIGFAGTANLNSPTANTSTEVVAWGSNAIGIHSGTFASLSPAAMVALASPWFFASGPLNNFWVVTDGGNTYTFNLTSSSVFSTSAKSITVALVGTVMSNVFGLDPTAFKGSLTLQDPAAVQNGVYTYTESMSFGSVPDDSTTALLLGSVLTGLALVKRKLTPAT